MSQLEHQPCRVCATTDDAVFRENRARVCEDCRPAHEARACNRCFEPKAPSQFPFGKSRYRRLRTCQQCIDQIAEEKRLQAIERSATWKNYKGVIVRRCSRCKVVRPLTPEYFYARPQKRKDRRDTTPADATHWSYYCKTCDIARTAAYDRDKRLQADPHYLETRRRAQKRWYANHPNAMREARARYEERKRLGLVQKRGWVDDGVRPRIPRDPFVAWVERTLPDYPHKEAFCELIGIPVRSLDRIMLENGEMVELDLADRAFQREGSTTLLDEYPHLFEEPAAVS